MKKAVYEMLTIRNNITLSKEALEYVASTVSIADLPSIVDELRKEQRPISVEKIKAILLKVLDAQHKKLKKDAFEVQNFGIKKKDPLAKFRFLRGKMSWPIQPICSLKQGQEASVFGEYHLDNLNRELLEDDQGHVQLDFSRFRGSAFLHENTFLGLSGFLDGKSLFVTDICLPSILPEKPSLQDSGNRSFLIFGDFEWRTENINMLKTIIKTHKKLDFIAFVGNFRISEEVGTFLETYNDVLFIFSPSKDDRDPTFLPRKIPTTCNKANFMSVTNPFKAQMGSLTLGVVMDEVFEAKTNGRYIGSSHLESFVKTYLSQYSLNPFGQTNLSFEEPFDIIAVLQKSFSCIIRTDNMYFVSLGCRGSNRVYLSYLSGKLSLIKF